MSMPPPRLLIFAVGCVVKLTTKTNLIIARTVSDIKALHPYFKQPTPGAASVAAEIYAYSAEIDSGSASGDIAFVDHTISVPERCVKIRAVGPSKAAKAAPRTLAGPVEMQTGTCYWLEPVRGRRTTKASKKRTKR